jgi:hypothetical protein
VSPILTLTCPGDNSEDLEAEGNTLSLVGYQKEVHKMVFVELRTVLLFAYLLFVIRSLFKWAHLRIFRETSVRSRMASVGLIAGSTSAVLLAFFYCYWWIAHELPAHGLALWTLFLVSESLAIVGLILALTGIGWVRQSGFLISLVVVFQWARPSVGRLILHCSLYLRCMALGCWHITMFTRDAGYCK